MGLALIVLGVVLAGLVANFLVENMTVVTATEQFTMFGAAFELTAPGMVAIAFVAGAASVILIRAGIRRVQLARRRLLEQRVETLEYENSHLKAQRNLETVVRIPEAAEEVAAPEAVAEVDPIDQVIGVADADPVEQVEAKEKPEPTKKSEPAERSEPAEQLEVVEQSDAVQQPETVEVVPETDVVEVVAKAKPASRARAPRVKSKS